MANEIWQNYTSGETLYACRFQLDGNVFITDGSSDEVWGAGASDADTYDVTITEDGSGGHYVGSFDAGSNIGVGTYRVAVYLQTGVNPADSDRAIGQGEIYWDGSAELNMSSLDTKIDDEIIGADSDTLETLSDQLDVLSAEESVIQNIYGPGE